MAKTPEAVVRLEAAHLVPLLEKVQALADAAAWASTAWGRREDEWIRSDMQEAIEALNAALADVEAVLPADPGPARVEEVKTE